MDNTPEQPPMPDRDVTSIEVKFATWKELNQQKEPGDSFDDVIQRLLHAQHTHEPEENEDPSDDDEPLGNNNIYDCPDCEYTGNDWDEFQAHQRDEHDFDVTA